MVPLWACGGREWAGATPAGPESKRPLYVPSALASAPPFISPSADPICGDNWKWDGIRCQQQEVAMTEDPALAPGASGSKGAKKAPGRGSQLLMTDIRPGDGKEARRGDTVKVHYVGTLPDGTEFDSSRRREATLEIKLGTGAVIKGFDTAIVGMKVGGLRRVTIPPELGYGRQGSPPRIPPNATLVFEIELMDVIAD